VSAMDSKRAEFSDGDPNLDASPLTRALVEFGTCKICGCGTFLFDVVDSNKHCSVDDQYKFGLSGSPVYYQKCESCDFIFTAQFDKWDHGAFSKFIYNREYALVDGGYKDVRPKKTAERFASILPTAVNTRVLDFGSGNGLFENELKARGFTNVESYDPFSQPNPPTGTFDIIVCTEVLEHSPSPRETLASIERYLAPDGVIVFTTAIQPPEIDSLRAGWWYIAPRNGHVSIYSGAALENLGKCVGLKFFRGPFHVFAGSEDHERIKEMKARRSISRNLWAPTEADEVSTKWNRVARNERCAFRWTAERAITWEIESSAPLTVFTFRIPFCGEVSQKFAAESKLIVGQRRVPLSVQRYNNMDALVCEVAVDRVINQVTLETPEPVAPPSDRRRLGLAIAVAPLWHASSSLVPSVDFA
jgi:SAM-dependent methyltransferase